jgi:hypothetical protein
MSKEDNMYRQGKTKRQLKASYIGASAGIIGMVILIILAIIFV